MVKKTAEEGTYDELIARDGLLAELVKRQRVDVDGRYGRRRAMVR